MKKALLDIFLVNILTCPATKLIPLEQIFKFLLALLLWAKSNGLSENTQMYKSSSPKPSLFAYAKVLFSHHTAHIFVSSSLKSL